MEHIKQTCKALLMVGIFVVGLISILVALEVISLTEMREPVLKTVAVLGIVGLMSVGLFVLQRK
jgi:hypothetical protein